MHNSEQKLILSFLKSKGKINKRQLAHIKNRFNSPIDRIIHCKYPVFLLQAFSQEEQIMEYLNDLEVICDYHCESKSKRRDFMLKKMCQTLFSQKEKSFLNQIFEKSFQADKQQPQSGAKKLYQLLQTIFAYDFTDE